MGSLGRRTPWRRRRGAWVDICSEVLGRSRQWTRTVRVDVDRVRCGRRWQRVMARSSLRGPDITPRLGIWVVNGTWRLFRSSQDRCGSRRSRCHAGFMSGMWRLAGLVVPIRRRRRRLHRTPSRMALVTLKTPLRCEFLGFLAQLPKYSVERASRAVDRPPSGADVDATANAHLVAWLERIFRRFD